MRKRARVPQRDGGKGRLKERLRKVGAARRKRKDRVAILLQRNFRRLARNCVLYRKSFLPYWLLVRRTAPRSAGPALLYCTFRHFPRRFCVPLHPPFAGVIRVPMGGRKGESVEGRPSPFAALIQVFKDTEHSVIAKVVRLKFRLDFALLVCSRRRLKFP